MKNRLLPTLAVLLFFLCFSCTKQRPSLCPTLLMADSLMWSHPDSALLLLQQNIAEPHQLIGEEQALYALLLTQAKYKNVLPLNDDSLIQIAVKYYQSAGEKVQLGKAYFYLGCVWAEQKKWTGAIGSYLEALELMSKSGDLIFESMLYSHLGNAYREQGLNETALPMYKKGYRLCAQLDSVRAFYLLKDIGDTFLVEYQLDSTLCYYKQALNLAVNLQDSCLLPLVYKNMAAVYNEQSKYAEAGMYISNALLYLTDGEDYAAACSAKGDILSNMNQKDSAIHYWTIGATSSNIYVRASSYHRLYKGAKERHDWRATAFVDSFLMLYDSIQSMDDRAELDQLMDNHVVELHKHELSNKAQRTMIGLFIAFLILLFVLVALYQWRDRCRRNNYMLLQRRLMENRAEILLLNEGENLALSAKDAKLYKLEEERLSLCLSLFKSTEGYKYLKQLEKATPKQRITLVESHRRIIVNDVRKTFSDVMADMKIHCVSLTNDDLFFCTLSLLHCSKDVMLDLMDVSADALKVRKSRIKSKMTGELFKSVFEI